MTAKEYYKSTRMVETRNWTLEMTLNFAEEYVNALSKHAVMPSHLQEVEKEAFAMIQKYGKKRAEEEAILIAESYIENVNNLEYYNAEKIALWDKQKFFWLEVAKCVRDWT